jgi:hypothetical protein
MNSVQVADSVGDRLEGRGSSTRTESALITTHAPLATALGTYYPQHYVVAVFPTLPAAMRARRELTNEGLADSAALCPGPEFLKNWSDFAAQRSPLERLADLFPAEEQAALGEYLAAAEHGAAFVTVQAATPSEGRKAAALLRRWGATAMRYYGENTITDLS